MVDDGSAPGISFLGPMPKLGVVVAEPQGSLAVFRGYWLCSGDGASAKGGGRVRGSWQSLRGAGGVPEVVVVSQRRCCSGVVAVSGTGGSILGGGSVQGWWWWSEVSVSWGGGGVPGVAVSRAGGGAAGRCWRPRSRGDAHGGWWSPGGGSGVLERWKRLRVASGSVGWWQSAGNGVAVPAVPAEVTGGGGSHLRRPLSWRGGAHGARARRGPRAVLWRPLAAARC